MSKKYAVWALSVFLAAAVQAEDLSTTDGTVYKDIKITEVTPIGLNFVSGEKACWVDFRDLAPEVAAKYGYNAAGAAAFEQSLAKSQGSTIAGNTPVTAPAATVTTPVAATTVSPQTATVTTPVAATTVSPQAATVTTPVAATTVSSQVATVATPAATATVAPQSINVSTPIASATVSSAPGASGISVMTPVASVTIGTPTPPPPAAKVIVVNNGDQVAYDEQLVPEPSTTVWVLWNGRYYPRYWWHYWYWDHHFVMWNGRYYPAHYFHGGGTWHQGRFYHYAPNPRQNFSGRGGAVVNRAGAPAARGYDNRGSNVRSSGAVVNRAGSPAARGGGYDNRGGSDRGGRR